MYVYSGKCRLCKCGLNTDLLDDSEQNLRTGDIVVIYVCSEDTGLINLHGLTVVVVDQFKNYTNSDPIEVEIGSPYVMGIRNSNLQDPSPKYPDQVWRARLVKKWEDVIEGERCPEFGFNYSEQ